MATNRQRMVSTFAPVSLVGLALLVGVVWFLGTPGPVYACKCAVPGNPSEELDKFSAVFAGRVVSVQHSYDPNAASVVPLRTAPRLASKSASCGRALSMRTCTSPHHRPAVVAGLRSSKEKSTSSTATTVTTMTAAIPSAYAVGLPSSSWRKLISTPSGRGKLL